MSARKDDHGKPRFDLIPVRPLQELARVYTIGASKYDDRNWEKGLAWGRVYAAMQRHANAWWSGERNDQADGQHHLASVAWCALALMEFEETHTEMDDRPNISQGTIMCGDCEEEYPNTHVCKNPEQEYFDAISSSGSWCQGTDPE